MIKQTFGFASTQRSSRALMVAFMAAASTLLHGCDFLGSQPVGYQSQIQLAENFLQAGDFDRAYNLFDQVDEANSRSAKVQLALGRAYFRQNAFLKAERAFDNASGLGEMTEAQLGLGALELSRNNAGKAMRIFANILVEDPENLRAQNGIGVAHDLNGDHYLAQVAYRNALKIDPGHVDAANNLGLSLTLSGSAESGASILAELASSQINDVTVRQNLAISYYIIGRKELALDIASINFKKTEALALFEAVSNYRLSGS
ncbi:tetratricopeptide repeat protein [Epibacterium ulvae]|uniref:tetratricopeptide repeat protein n=1 Tax=Epibacterium ulvae TaxID=1156985 RepID=UPI0024917842|nr:tetratricopeptide repeat protein [Epibacterium ulvae]